MKQPLLFELPSFGDERGQFLKIFHAQHPALQNFTVRQINFVQNPKANVLRGLHYQRGQAAEAKLFRVLQGVVQLVAFDTRRESPSYSHALAWRLSRPEQALYIPRGYATGYLVCQEQSHILYCSDNDYAPNQELGLRWNDPLIAQMVLWESEEPELSEKDRSWPNFMQL